MNLKPDVKVLDTEIPTVAANFLDMDESALKNLMHKGILKIGDLRRYCVAQTLNEFASRYTSQRQKYSDVSYMYSLSFNTVRQLFRSSPELFR